MDVSHIFDSLNDAQRRAVSSASAALLVLAGAGSGKTRVLTHRVAWLVQGLGVSAGGVLAVTFTNKAAREMRGRIEALLGRPCGGLWMGTFHGVGHRLLRRHFAAANLPQNFEILDADDQYRLVRRVLRELSLDEAYWPPRQMQWMINGHKEAGRRARHLPGGGDVQQQTLLQVYVTYEGVCQRLGLVDFAEILLRTLELLRGERALLEEYQQRFGHVLVDEFQDTNGLQYQWLRLLAGGGGSLFAVGDDDQSIYGWRGARVENLLSFTQDFAGAEVVRLEQNYRSTGNILGAANAVVAHNQGRMGKELWTEGAAGRLIRVFAARDEVEEARFVVEQVLAWVGRGGRREEVAVLYRSNAQSRVFEQELLQQGVPYRVYGGLRFFERAEIKDVLAYLRLVVNRDADVAFERVVNLPVRGIGSRTLEQVREVARAQQVSLWRACRVVVAQQLVARRACVALEGFVQLVDGLAAACAGLELAGVAEVVLQQSGLLEHYRSEKGERAVSRVENLEEFVNAAGNFVADAALELDALAQFLANAALEAGEGQAEEWQDCVQLMSLHSAKGLEFPLVFLCGMEEGLFPHQRALKEAVSAEEERRLCYVGMTRAMQQLFLCYAEMRRLYGGQQYTRRSRFLEEIPPEFVEEVRVRRVPGYAVAPRVPRARGVGGAVGGGADGGAAAGLSPGRQVRHRQFGDGWVVSVEGQGEHARLQVNFVEVGPKWLVAGYANLEVVGG